MEISDRRSVEGNNISRLTKRQIDSLRLAVTPTKLLFRWHQLLSKGHVRPSDAECESKRMRGASLETPIQKPTCRAQTSHRPRIIDEVFSIFGQPKIEEISVRNVAQLELHLLTFSLNIVDRIIVIKRMGVKRTRLVSIFLGDCLARRCICCASPTCIPDVHFSVQLAQ